MGLLVGLVPEDRSDTSATALARQASSFTGHCAEA
jgi:hypothetical protein